MDGLAGELIDFRPLHAVRGELLAQLGESDAAAQEFLTAAELPGNEAEASVLRRRADDVRAASAQAEP